MPKKSITLLEKYMIQPTKQLEPPLSKVAKTIPDFFILKIDKIANELIQAGEDVIKLNLGKSELPMPKYVEEELVNKMRDARYRETIDSQGLLSLREEITKQYQAYGQSLTADNVFINNGTSPFFLAFFLLLVNTGDEILLPLPYYPTYFAAANMVQAKSVFYGIRQGRINIDDVRQKFAPGKTKVVLLNSPGNPFGNVVSREEIQEILDIVDGRAYIISDEIYDGFVYENNFSSVLDVYNPERDLVIVINGFSKIHHMYTRRLGYAIVPNSLKDPLLRFQKFTVICVDPVTQYGGLVALKNKSQLIEEEIRQEVHQYKQRLEASAELISKTKLKIIKPEGSFYMSVDVSHYLNGKIPSSLAFAQELLDKAKVAVTPGEDFGLDTIFRISLTGGQTVAGVKRMCDYLLSIR